MKRTLIHTLTFLLVMGSAQALAEQHTVKMKNSGNDGSMVFEPGYLEASPGDTVKFVATDPAHNSVSEAVPEGAEDWSGSINEEITVTLSEEGVYVYKCVPHATLNMAGVISVGKSTNYDAAKAAVEKLSNAAAVNQGRLTGYFDNVAKP